MVHRIRLYRNWPLIQRVGKQQRTARTTKILGTKTIRTLTILHASPGWSVYVQEENENSMAEHCETTLFKTFYTCSPFLPVSPAMSNLSSDGNVESTRRLDVNGTRMTTVEKKCAIVKWQKLRLLFFSFRVFDLKKEKDSRICPWEAEKSCVKFFIIICHFHPFFD